MSSVSKRLFNRREVLTGAPVNDALKMTGSRLPDLALVLDEIGVV
jgi:hypothetical protein